VLRCSMGVITNNNATAITALGIAIATNKNLTILHALLIRIWPELF